MKYTLALTFLVAAAFAAGCKPAEEKSAAETREAMTAQYDKANKETKEATQDMKAYGYAQKADFVETMQNKLTELVHDRIHRSSARARFCR